MVYGIIQLDVLSVEYSWRGPFRVVNVAGLMQVSADGLLCATISTDRSAKIYDVVNYDMMAMLKLSFVPGAIEWVYKLGDAVARLAISDRASNNVHIFDARSGSNEPVVTKEVCIDIRA